MSDAPASLTRLLAIMATLRDPEHGCEWDRAQRFETIVPHTIEEAYEVADAVERGDIADIRDELGDLLFQVVFQARIAEEAGHFDFAAVATAIADKLEARHPHVFGNATPGDQDRDERWEALKAQERVDRGDISTMDGVALALPALMRAQKLQKRAARDGFDWPDPDGPKAKVAEEIEELEAATPEQLLDEAGDFLFAAVNLVRSYGVEAEEALRCGNAKFERRYRAMEALADGRLTDLALDEQENLWQAVKAAEPATQTPRS